MAVAAAGGLLGSGLSAMTVSVVSSRPAIDAAFCSAERVTLAGSTTPNPIMSPYSPVRALRPWPVSSPRTFSTMTLPSRPAFVAIQYSGADSAVRTMFAPVR